MVLRSGFRVQDLELRDWGCIGCMVKGLHVEVQGLGFWMGLRVKGLGFRVQDLQRDEYGGGLGCMVQGSGCRVQVAGLV